MKRFLAVMLLVLVTGCVHKPLPIVVPTGQTVFVPVGQCNLDEVITGLQSCLSDQDIDLSLVPPQERVKVLCQLAAERIKVRACVVAMIETMKENEKDCQATIDKLKTDSR